MADFYFERYRDQAAAALEGPMEQVSNGMLIAGIEDIGGEERTAIAHAVPVEAALVVQALRGTQVLPAWTVEHPQHDGFFKTGWYLGKLVDGAPYITEDGAVQREDDADIMLHGNGALIAYSSHLPYNEAAANGRALNRYEPVCATSMNDRAVLFGLAQRVAMHDLEIPRAS